MTEPAPPSPDRPGPTLLPGLLDIRPRLGVDAASVSAAEDAVAQGLAVVKVYAFASVDCPGAAESQVFDSDGTTAVGGFTFDPLSASPSGTAFTFAGGVYQIFTVPSSTSSVATGINGAGLIVGTYRDLSGVRRGFANNGAPSATSTSPAPVVPEPSVSTMPDRSWVTTSTPPTSSMDSSAAAAPSG